MATTTKAGLEFAIFQLEIKASEQKKNLLVQLQQTSESLKPVNLIKSSIHDITSGPGLGNKVLNATLGLGAGLISKKLMIGPSTNILKKIAGTAFEVGVAGVVAKNAQQIKTGAAGLFKKLFTRYSLKKKQENSIN